MKSGGGLLFTEWLLLKAWCLFSDRVSTATVVGNSSLQVATCKYHIFCSLDKYKLLVPHQDCAFAQKRLIDLKSIYLFNYCSAAHDSWKRCESHARRMGDFMWCDFACMRSMT